ncbi:MAG TPA: hypothetical protein VGZ00_01095 [Candidatus Baltobacteraceae bacterium]|nr:hypothetical protein [Candidatus Baltobacteraceae bacterium]
MALVFLVDLPLQRFTNEVGIGINELKEIGKVYNGVKFNSAIWALANQARHLKDWKANPIRKKTQAGPFVYG